MTGTLSRMPICCGPNKEPLENNNNDASSIESAEMPAKLSVNLNAIAMLRNRRDLPWPSVTGLGQIALEAGASGLTVHPRPDQRHIRFSDLAPIRALIDDLYPQAEFNMEGFPNEEFLELVERHQPEQVTLVPDDPAQATSDHGWDFRKNHNLLGNVVGRLKKNGFRVSLFADGDPDLEALTIAKETGADRIELYTGPYGGCYDDPGRGAVLLEELGRTADLAVGLGLECQCRARPDGRQSAGAGGTDFEPRRGLDRSRSDRRCAAIRYGGNRPPLLPRLWPRYLRTRAVVRRAPSTRSPFAFSQEGLVCWLRGSFRATPASRRKACRHHR